MGSTLIQSIFDFPRTYTAYLGLNRFTLDNMDFTLDNMEFTLENMITVLQVQLFYLNVKSFLNSFMPLQLFSSEQHVIKIP